MERMRSKAVLSGLALAAGAFPALLLAVGSCGGGGEKAAFDEYERKVGPILEKEQGLRERFEDEVRDAYVYDAAEKVGTFVEKKLLPFYEGMDAQVRAIRPEAGDLAEIHPLLVRYVELRREFLDLYRQVDALEKEARATLAPVTKKAQEANQAIESMGAPLIQAYQANPQAGAAFMPILKAENEKGREVRQYVAALEQGKPLAAQFLSALETDYRPFYAEKLDEARVIMESEENREIRRRVIDYLKKAAEYLDAAAEVARIRAEVERQMTPVGKKIEAVQSEAEDLLETYKSGARKYREGLR
jgi:hypothetical protein